MSAEISEVMVDGVNVVEAMYANSPAWHSLGEIFNPGGKAAPDAETAIKMAHLDWKVDFADLSYQWGDKTNVVTEEWGVVRQDIGAWLGNVGTKYEIFQNVEAFSFLDGMLQDGIMRYESAMALKGGKVVVLLARMPSVDTFAEGDHGLRYIMLSTSHDGSGAIQLLPTNVRVVCANTRRLALSLGKGKVHNIRHTGKLQEKLTIAQNYLSQFDKAFTLFGKQGQQLATLKASKLDVAQYLDKVFEKPEKEGNAMTRRNNQVEEVQSFLTKPANMLPSIQGSWWACYNAVSMAADHGNKFSSRGAGRDSRRYQENKFLSVMDGTLADVKDKAFALACDMAGVSQAA